MTPAVDEAGSSLYGPQFEVTAQFRLMGGNWWLAINGVWVGFYPGSIYRSGQMSKNAQQIEYGTETIGTVIWPGAGSGRWSTTGYGSAAYQRSIFYYNTSNQTVEPTLLLSDPSPACYTTSGPFYNSAPGWGVYFFEGGPGGAGCQ